MSCDRKETPCRIPWNAKWLIAVIAFALGMGLFAHDAQGVFVRVEDFEHLTLGSISGQSGWVAGSTTVVAEDPDNSDNQVLSVTNLGAIVRKDILLQEETTRMVFMRFRFSQQMSASFGLSYLSSPYQYSDFGPELNLSSASSDHLAIANGDTVGVYDRLTDVDTNTWHNVWLLVDNSMDVSQVWMNATPDGSATGEDILYNQQSEDTFGFRTTYGDDLIRFFIKTSSGGSGDFGPLYVDDIYLENTSQLNLTNPTLIAPADFDSDGDVDSEDFLAWQGSFGMVTDATHGDGDADGDGDVDGSDFLVWQTQIDGGDASATSTAVPEPASAMLLIMVAAMVAGWAKWRR